MSGRHGGVNVESQKEAILRTYLAIAKKYEKAYTLQAQKYTCHLLGKYHRVYISIRTLNRRLRELEDEGYLSRVRRHRAGEDGKMIFCSTLTHIRARAFNWAWGMGMKALKIFEVFRLPKLAEYRVTKAGYPSPVDNPALFIKSLLRKGAPSAVFPTA